MSTVEDIRATRNHDVISRKGRFENPQLPLVVFRVESVGERALHSNDFSVVVIVLEGRGKHVTQDSEYEIQAGDAFILRAGFQHGYRDLEDMHVVNVLFQEDSGNLFTADIRALPGYHALFAIEPLYRDRSRFRERLRLSPAQLRHVDRLARRIEREIEKRNPGYAYMGIALFMEIVCFLSRCYAEVRPAGLDRSLRIAEAISFLERNYPEKIALPELARIAHQSERAFTRTFGRAMGRTPVEYLLRLRIGKACELLRTSDAPITEIAFAVGFQDSSYFSRQFRKATGVAPRTYRKSSP